MAHFKHKKQDILDIMTLMRLSREEALEVLDEVAEQAHIQAFIETTKTINNDSQIHCKAWKDFILAMPSRG